jgi:hypothetical protein
MPVFGKDHAQMNKSKGGWLSPSARLLLPSPTEESFSTPRRARCAGARIIVKSGSVRGIRDRHRNEG